MTILAAVARRALPMLVLGLAGGLLPTTVARGQACLGGTLADEFRAADAGLVREWIVQVPFDSAGWRLERVVVGDGLVLAQSGDGSVHAIRSSGTGGARAGTVAWSQAIPAAAGHSWPPTVGDRLVVMSSELAVHALDRDTGVVEWERPSGSLTAGSAVQSGDWVYQPLRTQRILRLPVNPLAQPNVSQPTAEPPAAGSGEPEAEAEATPRAPERLDPVSIAADGDIDGAAVPLANGVLWLTNNGVLALESTLLGWIRHRLPEADLPTWIEQASLVLAGPPVARGNTIFLASPADGVIRIDLNALNKPGLSTTWLAPLPDRPTSGPLVSGDVVLVTLGPSGVAAVAAADGRLLWRSELVGTLVAAAGGRAWLLDTVGRLTALDLATGSRRQSFCTGCFTLPVVNTTAERLVLASPGGVVVSLAAPPAPAPPHKPVNAPGPGPEGRASEDPDATPR